MTIIDPIQVGFWRTEGRAAGPHFENAGLFGKILANVVQVALESHLPSVQDHIDSKWSPKERALVIRYVSDPRFRRESYRGWSTCRICGKENGSADFSDGLYVWPEGFAHYLSEHAVRPPATFVLHALGMVKR